MGSGGLGSGAGTCRPGACRFEAGRPALRGNVLCLIGDGPRVTLWSRSGRPQRHARHPPVLRSRGAPVYPGGGGGGLGLEKGTDCGPSAAELWLLRANNAKKGGLSRHYR